MMDLMDDTSTAAPKKDLSTRKSSKVDDDDDDDPFDLSQFTNVVSDVNTNTDSTARDEKPKKKEMPSSSSSGNNNSNGGNKPLDDWSKLTVVVLKEKCRERGLKVSGRKADLIGRLMSS